MDSKPDNAKGKPQQGDSAVAAALAAVGEAIGRMRYGAIELTVHDGRVVQLDVTERRRFS